MSGQELHKKKFAKRFQKTVWYDNNYASESCLSLTLDAISASNLFVALIVVRNKFTSCITIAISTCNFCRL